MFFNFWKKINEKNVDSYNIAIKVIKMYISSWSFNKAIFAVDEIIEKENTTFKKTVEEIQKNLTISKANRKIQKEQKKLQKKINTLGKLKNKARILGKKYETKIKAERFKIVFKNTKQEIKNLLRLKKPLEALSVLKRLLIEHKDKTIAINYYNREKVKIQKHIDKNKKYLQNQLKADSKAEAMSLIWEIHDSKNQKTKVSFTDKIKAFFQKLRKENFLTKIKKSVERDRLMREVKEMLEKSKLDSKNGRLEKSMENIHKWLIKELKYDNLIWYDVYGKILWADKISGDTFWIKEKKDSYNMYLWDATWHGIKAGLIITLLHKAFRKFENKNLKEMVFEVNNSLKQKLESRNFITWAFFEISKQNHRLDYIWMWHEPIFIYNKKNKKAEKKVLWGLAAGIRIIKQKDNLKVRSIELQDGDIIAVYSDGIVEARNETWELYSIERFRKSFESVCKNETNLKKIYNFLIEDLKIYSWWTKFNDDATILLLKRDSDKDIINKEDDYLEIIKSQEQLDAKDVKQLEWKTKEEIDRKLKEIKKQKETKRVINILKNIYHNWEILKLKQEAVRYIKEGFIDKKINYYLKKALEQERSYKIEQKNQKMQNKYKVLTELLKKWDYETVLKESEEIIAKDWWI